MNALYQANGIGCGIPTDHAVASDLTRDQMPDTFGAPSPLNVGLTHTTHAEQCRLPVLDYGDDEQPVLVTWESPVRAA